MNHAGQSTWRAWSAGSQPTGKPNPFSLKTLDNNNIPVTTGEGTAPSSKSWDKFARPDAPNMDVIVTVCDNAAGEVCPIWPTRAGGTPPTKLHWSFPDPAATQGSDAAKAASFQEIFQDIQATIDKFLLDNNI